MLDLKADLQQGWLAFFVYITPRQRHSWPCCCTVIICPRLCICLRGFSSKAELTNDSLNPLLPLTGA